MFLFQDTCCLISISLVSVISLASGSLSFPCEGQNPGDVQGASSWHVLTFCFWMLGVIEVGVAYCCVTSCTFNSLKHNSSSFACSFAVCSGLCRGSFSAFHMASAKASSAGQEGHTQDAPSHGCTSLLAVSEELYKELREGWVPRPASPPSGLLGLPHSMAGTYRMPRGHI